MPAPFAVVHGLLGAGILLAVIGFYGIFALLALPAPVVLVTVAFLYFQGRHAGSMILAGFLAWVPGILVIRASDAGSHSSGMGALFGAVLFTGPILSFVGFCVTLAARIGSKWTRHAFDFALIASIGIVSSSLAMEIAQRRHVERQVLPALVRSIYKAELDYSAGRPDKSFTCDVKQLPALSALAWQVDIHPGGLVVAGSGWSAQPSVGQLPYQIEIRCFGGAIPHVFRVVAWYENHNRLLKFFSYCPCETVTTRIGEAGELVFGDPF